MASSPFLNEIRTSVRVRGMSIRTEKHTFSEYVFLFGTTIVATPVRWKQLK